MSTRGGRPSMREGPLSELFRNTDALNPRPPQQPEQDRGPGPSDLTNYVAVIRVVGVGGAGCNAVDRMIEAVDRAAKSYPWPDTYKAFPGPNSNTFTAWISRRVPELGLELPFSAIGSGYVDSAAK